MQQLTVMAISSRTSYTVGTSGMAPTALSFLTTCGQRTQGWNEVQRPPMAPQRGAAISVSGDEAPGEPGQAQRQPTVWLQWSLGVCC